MQQSIYNSIALQTAKTNKTSVTGSRRTGMARRLARSWDLYGALALMGSGAAYGVFALAHLGL